MNSKHLIVTGCLTFAAFSFYFLPIKNKKKQKDWRSIFPEYINDSIYTDAANPFSEEKKELGRYLFYDRRLSVNKSKSCASCHDPKFSFTDNYRRSIGAMGDLHQRNASPLINIIFRKYLTGSDSSLHYPEQQMSNPMFHEQPIELGWQGKETAILNRIKQDDFYKNKFNKAFPDIENAVTTRNIQFSIATFIKTIVSFNAPYDQYVFHHKDVLTAPQKRGAQLFFSKDIGCSNCHAGIDFATPVFKDSTGEVQFYFNTGLYNIDGKGSYPVYDQGLIEKTHNNSDMGKYRVATLRNLAFTAPYYHDGSAVSLEEVIESYEMGGRVISNGLLKGNGFENPYKSSLIKGFSLTSQQRKDMVQFLLSLSDSSLLINKSFSNPFEHDETN